MSKTVKFIVLPIIGFVLLYLGFVVGKINMIQPFIVERNVNLVDLSSLIATIILAILVTLYFDKKSNNNRLEKDLIIKKIENISHVVENLHNETDKAVIGYSEAASGIKRINVSLDALFKTSEDCHFTICEQTKTEGVTLISELRDLLTKTPTLSQEDLDKVDLPAQVKDGIIHFTTQQVSLINLKFDKLKDYLLKLQLEINRA